MSIHYQDDAVTVHAGDCLDILRELPDASVDAVVCDPPYGLAEHPKTNIEKALLAWLTGDREHVPDGRGFMGRSWDAFVPPPAVWDECHRVLKPGGHLLAFAGSRTHDLMALSIRLAGFEKRDEIASMAWVYASGFPKSLDVSKAIDKQRTEDREPVDRVRAWLNERRIAAGYSHDAVNKHFGHASNGGGSSSAWMTNPTSRNLPTWDQWQELRALFGFGDEMDAEVWRLNGRKGMPGEGWTSRDVVGQYNQPDPRLQGWAEMQGHERGTAKEIRGGATTDAARQWQGWGTALKPAFEPIVVARKPLQGTVAACVTTHGTGALNIDATRVQSGERPKMIRTSTVVAASSTENPSTGATSSGELTTQGRWPSNLVLTHAPDCVPAGAPDGGLWACADGCPVRELDRQSGVLTSRGAIPANPGGVASIGMGAGGTSLVGYGDSGGASRFFPTFRYEPKAPTSERPRVQREDGTWEAHATVKPLDLMRWLVRLVTPPGGLVLDPFAGSGTTAEACILEGFRCVTIEREAAYLPLIVARLTKPLQPDLFGGAA